jgi:hypothetical protein
MIADRWVLESRCQGSPWSKVAGPERRSLIERKFSEIRAKDACSQMRIRSVKL